MRSSFCYQKDEHTCFVRKTIRVRCTCIGHTCMNSKWEHVGARTLIQHILKHAHVCSTFYTHIYLCEKKHVIYAIKFDPVTNSRNIPQDPQQNQQPTTKTRDIIYDWKKRQQNENEEHFCKIITIFQISLNKLTHGKILIPLKKSINSASPSDITN